MHKISLSSAIVVRFLTIAAIMLVLASIGGQFFRFALGHGHVKGLVPLFYLDQEQNIPTYFSCLLMLMAALLLGQIAVLQRKQRLSHVSRWIVLCLGFVYMAYDEAFSSHEQLVTPMRNLLGGENLGILYYAWVVPGIGVVLILGIWLFPFLLQLSSPTRSRFLLAASLYLGGAIGIEMLGGWYAEAYTEETWMYSMIATVEESLEIAGLIVFVWALLKYCAENYREVHLRFIS